ncbi:hypothetical protein ACIOUE_38220 [Streptomyces xanthochromogenes]|uniref:hypothetical protein n=1 Tax=Streptomyces xanthochromogenes TaxID=67384 RepID=UPI003826F0DC
MTAEELFPLVLPARVALCIECKTLTRAPIAVRWIQSTSGPGTTLYACPDHAVKLGAGPTPDDVTHQ